MFSWRRSGTLPFRPIKSRLASWPPTTVTPGARPTTTLSRVSPQEKIIVEFIKITVQKFTYTWFLILCCYLNDPQLCFIVQWQLFMSLFSWTVKLSSVLQKNPSAHTNSLVFQHFCVFEPFQTMTVWFWDPSFHTELNWETPIQLLQKIQTLTDAPEEKTRIKGNFLNLKIRVNLT